MKLKVIDSDSKILEDLEQEEVTLSRRDLMYKENLVYIVSQGIDELDIELSKAYIPEFVADLFKISKVIKGSYSGTNSDLAKIFKLAFPEKGAFITKALIRGQNLMEVGSWL